MVREDAKDGSEGERGEATAVCHSRDKLGGGRREKAGGGNHCLSQLRQIRRKESMESREIGGRSGGDSGVSKERAGESRVEGERAKKAGRARSD